MPLGPAGQKTLTAFIQQYGAKKGKSVFYAKENADPKFSRMVKNKNKK
jgi:hypothetical protein